jgi:glycosyltransferase involved in cell wall biosynthesis
MVPVKLDVVIPSYNRSHLLRRTIESLLRAPIPAGLDVTIVPVDNNSTDDTAAMVAAMQSESKLPIRYVKELRQSSSCARNAGINSGNSDIIGFVDDDEQVDEHWFQVVAREFADPDIEFIGGPYLPDWTAPIPPWLPPGYNSAIGIVEPKTRAPYDASFPGVLMGGNAVVRRSVYDRVGLYSDKLGRSGTGLLSEEDAEFHRRMMAAGIRGLHIPDLIIYHHIPASRLTRSYHRRWCFWRGVSQGVLDREIQEPVAYAAGIPRYKFGRAIRGLALMPRDWLAKDRQGQTFADELASWDLAGFIYGKHFIRIDRYYAQRK